MAADRNRQRSYALVSVGPQRVSFTAAPMLGMKLHVNMHCKAQSTDARLHRHLWGCRRSCKAKRMEICLASSWSKQGFCCAVPYGCRKARVVAAWWALRTQTLFRHRSFVHRPSPVCANDQVGRRSGCLLPYLVCLLYPPFTQQMSTHLVILSSC